MIKRCSLKSMKNSQVLGLDGIYNSKKSKQQTLFVGSRDCL